MSTSAIPAACNNAIVEIGDHFRAHLSADFANYPPDFFLQLMDALWIICIHLTSNIPIKKSHWVRSHDLGGQFWLPRFDIRLSGNFSLNNAIDSREVWLVAPSC
ncbi:unnamed protein product [Macrosiphum euphorbiae]|uniref:Uncharacterized protein n=1 Tax=Macrosiphum euphorbiae TaxID=13131 RepID=A0AAV0VTZ1_9HEMI|nr:unnamed protein product [Macrosiphum euphorbiae]